MLARKRSAIALFIVVVVLIMSGCVAHQPRVMTAVVTPTLPGVSESRSAVPTGEGHTAPQSPIVLEGVSVTDTVTISITVSGRGHYLFDTPTLQGEPAAPGSVEQARFDLLERSRFGLVFPRPDREPPWLLVFNPEHEPGNYVAPRAELEVNP